MVRIVWHKALGITEHFSNYGGHYGTLQSVTSPAGTKVSIFTLWSRCRWESRLAASLLSSLLPSLLQCEERLLLIASWLGLLITYLPKCCFYHTIHFTPFLHPFARFLPSACPLFSPCLPIEFLPTMFLESNVFSNFASILIRSFIDDDKFHSIVFLVL